MNEREIQRNEEMELDIGRLLRAIWEHAGLIAIVSVACMIITLAGTFFMITPKYESSAMFYVNNNSRLPGDSMSSVSSGDLSTSRNLVDSYIVILNTRETLLEVINYARVDKSVGELKEMITAEAVNETEIFRVSISSSDPQEAWQLASAVAAILPDRIGTIIDGTSAKVVADAVKPEDPSSPSYPKNAVIGFMLGFALIVAFVVLREIFDVTIRTEEDIAQVTKLPVLAAVPDMENPGKGGYYYGYGEKKKKSDAAQKKTVLIGEKINFAASEAYKLLRTKLQYSFADEGACRVIGISSAMTGEGKSLTAINLAFTLSQLGERVLLIDCDMRRPSVAMKLSIPQIPGLSSYLSGQAQANSIIQMCGLEEDEKAFHVIAAGPNPPNPVELLSSSKMSKLLAALKNNYDYIILDLPPIGEVSDALAVVKETAGVLLVVRKNQCNRNALNAAIRQFEFLDSRILGITFNGASDDTAGYGKKYYKKYYQKSAARNRAK